MKKNISRKEFIKGSALALAVAGMPLGVSALDGHTGFHNVEKELMPSSLVDSKVIPDQISISIFSKHLHWLNYKDMAELTAQMGFDGIDLTVRPGGHVTPEKVADDLPKAVEAIQKVGLKVYTITTDIKSAEQKYTADILKAASQSGIKKYRMGWYSYDQQKDIVENLEDIKKRFAGLAALNEQYQIHGDYQNHTGHFGASIWDLWMMLKDLKSAWNGCQFDIRHATVDGAEAWPTYLDLLHKNIGSIALKDFFWKKANDQWQIENVPLGQGMVDFKRYFELIKKYQLQVPISLHYEYPLGGADKGASKLTISREQLVTALQTDLKTLKSWLKNYELI